jgi:hypothetical protein
LPAVSLGDIGLSGPVELLGSSSSGAWVALCDSERRARLVLGAGPGEVVDDVLAEDPSGRYLVVADGDTAQLVDAAKGSRVNLTELGADVRRLRTDFAAHRTLSFDAAGQYLAYSRRSAGTPSQLVVRHLEAGTERAFSVGAGELLRLELSADARWVTFEVIREDTNHNGRLDWPAPEEPSKKSGCEKPPLRFRTFAYQGRGDATVRGALNLSDAVVRDVPELLAPLGASLLLRLPDGALVLEQAGKRTPLAPAACAARTLFADAERGLVLATCAPPPPKKVKGRPAPPPTGKREVWLFGPGGVAIDLKRELYETSVDRGAVLGTRLVPLYPGSEANLLDLERRELLPLPPGSRVLTTEGALALVWRDSELYRYDAQSKREERLARGVAKTPELLRAGSTVLLSPFLVVGIGAPALASPVRPLAITTDGFVLTGSSDGAGAIQAPLHWVDARLPPLDGPPR